MLNAAQARDALASFTVDVKGRDERQKLTVTRVSKLPRPLRESAFLLMDLATDGSDPPVDAKSRQRFEHRQAENLQRISAMKGSDLRKLLTAFCGAAAQPIVETIAWQREQAFVWGTVLRAPKADTQPVNFRLIEFAKTLGQYIQPDVPKATWLAEWASHLSLLPQYGWALNADHLAPVFAAAISRKGAESDRVFEILCETLRGEHETCTYDGHVLGALLAGNRPEGWELVEKTLLAAQRQEGLRSDILAALPGAHPVALRRMLAVCNEHKLARFTSVWSSLANAFGFLAVDRGGMINDMTPKQIRVCLEIACEMLASKKPAALAAKEPDAERLWFALWATGTNDVDAARKAAIKRLDDSDAAIRFVALQFLRFSQTEAGPQAARLVSDPHRQVADAAYWLTCSDGAWGAEPLSKTMQQKRFDAIESYIDQLPTKSYTLEPIVWPWTAWTINPESAVYALMHNLGDLPPTRLLRHLDRLDTWKRRSVVELLAAQKKWNNETRDALRDLATDRSGDVAISAVNALVEKNPDPGDVEVLEGLLTRSSNPLRQAVFKGLKALPKDQPLESATRLLASGKAPQRLAGLEILRQLQTEERFHDRPREMAAEYAESKSRISKQEQTQLDALLAAVSPESSAADGFGLIDADSLTRPVPPKKHKVKLVTPATTRMLQGLDDLIHKHSKAEYTDAEGTIRILGEDRWSFRYDQKAKNRAAIIKSMPLSDLWMEWFDKRPKAMRDKDGRELIRAVALSSQLPVRRGNRHGPGWFEQVGPAVETFVLGKSKLPTLRRVGLVTTVLQFLAVIHPPDQSAAGLPAMVWETILAHVDVERYLKTQAARLEQASTPWQRHQIESEIWQHGSPLEYWQSISRVAMQALPKNKRKTALNAFFPLALWADAANGDDKSAGIASGVVLEAYQLGVASLDDVLAQATTPVQGSYGRRNFGLLTELTKPENQLISTDDRLAARLDELVGRIVETELARGEASTHAASMAEAVSSVPGTDRLLAMIAALDKKGYARGSRYRSSGDEGLSRRESLTMLIKAARPRPDETPDVFASQVKATVKAGEIPEGRILELAFLAPQWVRHVEGYLKWNGFAEAVYWFMAHMRGWGMGTEAAAEAAGYEAEKVADDADWQERQRAKSGWDRLIGERTPISKDDREAGAIDVAWFESVYSQLKPARWERIAEAARFADNAQQAKRAKFVGDVLAGRAERRKLVADIAEKRLKDSVRLFGLLPLANGKAQAKDIRDRYEILTEYQRYARTLSGLTRPDAERAVGIGLDNLARLAGYPDPLRMHWALEADSTSDLIDNPIVVAEGDASFTLELDDQALPITTIRRGERVLKSLPKELKKHPEVATLRERAKVLKQLNTRSRRALEEAMIRGDTFTGTELKGLASHAVVWPMLSRLVLLGENGIAGYPDKKGRALRSFDGSLEPVKAKEALRIAHPIDLFEGKKWARWQKECLAAERVQPFKQVFRELYPLTAAEKKGGGTKEGRRADANVSQRYAGQQVQPSQALALFGSRGWSTSEGIWKTDHVEKITAEVYGELYYGSVAQYELPTVEGVVFRRVGEWKSLPLHQVPPRLFSEIMRDVDLAVSVAHAGGVDPEASESTVEMRAALLKETCTLLKLKNVKIELKKVRAFIKGHFGEYSVHLGSGTVHRLPGGAVCLVPVHSQHRGRLFLPFADNDPRTAEVMSKVLLLAKDKEIKDNELLSQLRG